MSAKLQGKQIQPMIILPPDTMSKEDIERLRENGMCVVEAKEPALVRFMDPIPATVGRTHVEDAAIRLSRKLLKPGHWATESTRRDIAATFVDILVEGTPLDPEPSKEERELAVFDQAKAEELRRLAREEAKAERAAMKAAQKKPVPPPPPSGR